MTLRWSLVALAVAFFTSNLPAQPASTSYSGLKFVLVQETNPDKGVVTAKTIVNIMSYMPSQVEKVVIQNGKKVTVKQTVYVPVLKTKVEQYKWSVQSDKAFDHNGKPVSRQDVFQRVKPGSIVIIFTTPGRPDPAALRLLNKDAVVLQITSRQK